MKEKQGGKVAILEVKDLSVNYGAVKALHGISFYAEEGEVVSLIGSNGAGKTTTLHAISALVKKQGGSVLFSGIDITNMSADEIVSKHLIQVPEGRHIFQNLTVKDNLDLGSYLRRDTQGIKEDREKCFALFPRLKERIKQNALTLSGGEQQMLAIARALMARPKMLLLDEPSMGLAPILVDEIFSIIRQINEEGVTVLLVEQNAYKALSVADRAYVLETGNIIKSGKASEIKNDSAVQKAYLGG